jgi:hypothetical protein
MNDDDLTGQVLLESLADAANKLIKLTNERKVILSRLEKIIEGENK